MQGKRLRDWEIEGLLGEGGMGQVWRARHALLNRIFAIKVIARELSSDPRFESLFIREAGMQAALQHPHIIPATDFFVEDGLHYLVMPYVDGQSLEERMEKHRDPKSGKRLPLPHELAMAVAFQVLHALDYAHQNRVIHRDVKPSNILLDQRGDAYLTDFGVALKTDKPRTTSSGKAIGTSAYMSPEQIQRPREMDHRTDVYSFGCVLYEMLSGSPVFETDGVEGDTDFFIKESQIKRMPEPLRKRNAKVSVGVEAVVTKALAKSPRDRFAGCGEFARALAKAIEGTESLIHCPKCASKNKIEKLDLLAQVKCVACDHLLLRPVETRPAPRTSSGWTIATVVLSVVVFIMMIGWAVTADERKKEELARLDVEIRLSNMTSAKNSLDNELESAKKERADLQADIGKYKSAPASIVVRNDSSLTIVKILMYKTDETGTHKDHLGSKVLAAGNGWQFKVSPGTYKFETGGDGGASCSLPNTIEVSGSSEKTIELKDNFFSSNTCKLRIDPR